ncbi:MAG: cytochrome P450 [Acidimicrobiales bacterium]|nr:cytochrome P450 [Acidimicrobiales bacterium]
MPHSRTDTDIFTASAGYADPKRWHEEVTSLRQEAPVVEITGTGIDRLWAVLRAEELLEVERQSELFISGEGCNTAQALAMSSPGYAGAPMKTLVEMDGAEHQGHRLVVNKWFLPGSIRRLDDAITARAQEAISIMESHGGECDFAQDVALHYPLKVIMTLFGVPDEDVGLMLGLTQALMEAQEPEAGPQAQAAMLEFFTYFNDLAAQRRAKPTDDLASLIANAEIDGEPVGDLGVFGLYLVVATAGHDTTSGAVAGGLEALIDHPDELDKLRADPGLIEGATEEIIRWVSPVKHFMRTATADYTLAGAEVSAGDRLLLSYPSANRDETYFEDPLRFDVTRADADRQVAFGFGRHFCLGAHLARMEVTRFYELLVPRLAHVEATGPCVHLASPMVSGPAHQPIRYTLT